MGASPSTQPPSFICMIYCSRTLSFLFKSSCPQASRQKRGCKGEGEQAAPHKVRTCSASGISPASLAGRAWEVAWSPLGLPFSLSMKCSPQFPIYATWLLWGVNGVARVTVRAQTLARGSTPKIKATATAELRLPLTFKAITCVYINRLPKGKFRRLLVTPKDKNIVFCVLPLRDLLTLPRLQRRVRQSPLPTGNLTPASPTSSEGKTTD